VKPTTGNTTGLHTVTCTGPLASFSAPQADLNGAMTISGGVVKVTLRSSGGQIILGNAALPKSKAGLVLGNVDGLTLRSDMPLGTLQANWWLDDSGDSAIIAPSLDSLQIGGSKVAHSAFAGDVTLTGVAKGSTLGRVSIGGDASGQWTLTGQAGTIAVSGNAGDYHLVVHGNLASLAVVGQVTTSSVSVDKSLASISAAAWAGGSVEADVLGTLTVKGDFHADLTVHNTHKAAAAIAKATIGGWLDNAAVDVLGNVSSFTVGGMRNATVYAGIAPGVKGLPVDILALAAGMKACINKFSVLGVAGETYSMINSNVAAYSLKGVSLRDAQKDNSANGHAAFGVAAQVLAGVKLRQGKCNYSWPNVRDNCWLPDAMDLKVRMLE
jgi:hypothetical protein